MSGATSYDIKQKPGRGTDSESIYRVNDTSLTIGNLTPRTLYSLQIRAVKSSGSLTSSWSDKIYTYPTREPLPSTSRQVSTYEIIELYNGRRDVLIAGYQRYVPEGASTDVPGYYSYRICSSTLIPESNRANIIQEIDKAAEIWESVTGILTATNSETDCTSEELIINEDLRLIENNIIRFTTPSDTKGLCGVSKNGEIYPGCVYHYPNPLESSNGAIDETHIFIYDISGTNSYITDRTVAYDTGPTSAGHTIISAKCSTLFQMMVHEIGHAFGLGDRDIGKFSVMSSNMYKFCEPTPLDIVAIKAIYQSRK